MSKQKRRKGKGGKEDARLEEIKSQMPDKLDILLEEKEEAYLDIGEILEDIEKRGFAGKLGKLEDEIEEKRQELLKLTEDIEVAEGSELDEIQLRLNKFREKLQSVKLKYDELVKTVKYKDASPDEIVRVLTEAMGLEKQVETGTVDVLSNASDEHNPLFDEARKTILETGNLSASEPHDVSVKKEDISVEKVKESKEKKGKDLREYIKGLIEGSKSIFDVRNKIIEDMNNDKDLRKLMGDLVVDEVIQKMKKIIYEGKDDKERKDSFLKKSVDILGPMDNDYYSRREEIMDWFDGASDISTVSPRDKVIEKVKDLKNRGIIKEAVANSTIQSLSDRDYKLGCKDDDKEGGETGRQKFVHEVANIMDKMFLENEATGAEVGVGEVKEEAKTEVAKSEEAAEEKVEVVKEETLTEPVLFTDDDMDKILDLMEAESDNLKTELEEKRKKFVKAKKDFDNRDKLKTKIGRFFSKKSSEDLGIDLALARDEYEKTRAEYIGSEIAKALEERMTLVEQQLQEKIKSVGKLEQAWSKIRGFYKKLGDLNSELLMKNKPKSWYGKMGARMLSVRTAISSALLGVGILTGGAARIAAEIPRAGMRFIGMSGLTFDLLQIKSIAKEETTGLLEDLDESAIGELTREEIIKRLQMIEARSVMDGVQLSESKYKDLYNKLQRNLENRFGEEEGFDYDLKDEKEKINLINNYLNNSSDELEDLIKKLEGEKRRHKKIAASAGMVAAAGWAGKVIGDLIKYVESTSTAGAVKGWFGIPDSSATHEVSTEVPLQKPTGEPTFAEPSIKPTVEPTPEPVVEKLTPKEFKVKFADSIVHDKGGVTAVLEKDLRAHPEHLESFRHIKSIDKILDKYGESYDKIPKSDLDRAAWLIELDKEKGFGGEVLTKGPDGNIAVIFDESAGRYKIGTLDGSKIENSLYEKLDIKVGKIPTVIEQPADELINPYPESDDLSTGKEISVDGEDVYETKKINVPVTRELPSGSTFSGFDEISYVASHTDKAAQDTVSQTTQAVDTMKSSLGSTSKVDAVSGADHRFDKSSPQTTEPVVESNKDVAKEAVEKTNVDIATAEKVYREAWKEVTKEMNNLLKLDNTVPSAIFGGSDESKEFIINVSNKLKQTFNFDASRPHLESALSPDASKTLEQAVIESEILDNLPPEADILLAEVQPGDVVIISEEGSHAIKFVDPGTGKSFFVYNSDYTFLKNENGEVIARKGGIDTVLEPKFVNGKLDIDMNNK